MRIVKDADVRKNEILDAAEALFAQKGFEETSISDIIEKVAVARGTVYYHFKSKEDIMDALIDRVNNRILSAAREIAADKNTPVFERLFKTLIPMKVPDSADHIKDQMHKPQNALMHQKSKKVLLKGIPPILAEIVKDGIKEKLMSTPYPLESIEMIFTYVLTVFDDDYMNDLPPKERVKRIKAFVGNLEKIFGAKGGSFAPVMQLFPLGG